MTNAQRAPRKSDPMKSVATKKTSKFGVRTVDSILDELDGMRERITQRAYEIFNLNGCRPGRDLEDWLEAEQELTHRPPIELSEDGTSLTLEAATPGFEPDDLDVQVTSEHILIQSVRTRPRTSGPTLHRSEFSHGMLFRDVHLPQPIDPDKAKAEYRNGLLRVTAPVVANARRQHVRVASQ